MHGASAAVAYAPVPGVRRVAMQRDRSESGPTGDIRFKEKPRAEARGSSPPHKSSSVTERQALQVARMLWRMAEQFRFVIDLFCAVHDRFSVLLSCTHQSGWREGEVRSPD